MGFELLVLNVFDIAKHIDVSYNYENEMKKLLG